MPSRKTIEETIVDLSNPDPQIVLKALDRLCREDASVSLPVAQIIPLLSDQNWRIRARAARCLEYIETETDAAVTGLTGALSDPFVSVRIGAAAILGVLSPQSSPVVLASAVLALTNALQDPAPHVRAVVGHALKSLGHPDGADRVILEWHNRTIEKRIPKPGTVEKFVAALKESDPKKRIAAMRKLSDVLDARQADLNALVTLSVPDLISLLRDPSWKVRVWAARLLGRIGPNASTAVPHLILVLQDRTNTVRGCAAYALGRLGEQANVAIPVLIKSLHDPARNVRTSAHMALRNLRHEGNGSETKINEDDELVSYAIDDDQLDIHYSELRFIKRRPWPYRTHLISKSKQYTLEQLYWMVQNNPDDYAAKVMLAERMENWEEKIKYIRQNAITVLAPGGGEEENEWRKTWSRLFAECPSFSFIESSSIHKYPIPGKFKALLNPKTLEGVSEKICQISDFIDPAGSAKQGFLGGRQAELHVIGAFDRIIKLTYSHFLCKQGSTYTLYDSPDETFLVPAAQVTLEEEPTLEKVVEKISEADPRVSNELSEYLWKDPDRRAIISKYRQYVTCFEDFINLFAYGRVIMDEHFHVTPLDLV